MFSEIAPEHMEIITRVVERVKKKPYSFMTEDDVSQEAFVIACKILKDWDGTRCLENFLMYSVSRRIISLSRNYYKNQDKRDVLDFSQILVQPTVEYDMTTRDLVDYVLDNLSVGMRADYLRWANGVQIPYPRKEALIFAIKELVHGQEG